MSLPPILVLQMQRMGDLILTFPLLALLQKKYPGHPIWTVSEPRFFQELHPLCPPTVFFPPEARERLCTVHYKAVINLSHRPDAAAISGSVSTDARFGAYDNATGSYIDGYWSLYRASIVHNNRHNLFHWGDLQLLDHCDGPLPHFDPITTSSATSTASGRVGIFVGASEQDKRPSPQFFGQLAAALLRKGLRPFFLGGPDDVALGREAQRASAIGGIGNLCGKHSVAELSEVLRSLALCITPDTGPMHLAAWVGTPVLNLSLGPVNAFETGPRLPGHHVLRPRMSCVGCWQCVKEGGGSGVGQARCHERFHAGRVALVAHTLLHSPARLASLRLPGLSLSRTTRDTRGLYTLEPVLPEAPSHRMLLAHFWREWFWARQSTAQPMQPPQPLQPLEAAAAMVQTQAPQLAHRIARCLPQLGKGLARQLAHELTFQSVRQTAHQAARPLSHPLSRPNLHGGEALPAAFWQSLPPLLRPFSGHMELYLQNAEYSPAALEKMLEEICLLARLFPAE